MYHRMITTSAAAILLLGTALAIAQQNPQSRGGSMERNQPGQNTERPAQNPENRGQTTGQGRGDQNQERQGGEPPRQGGRNQDRNRSQGQRNQERGDDRRTQGRRDQQRDQDRTRGQGQRDQNRDQERTRNQGNRDQNRNQGNREPGGRNQERTTTGQGMRGTGSVTLTSEQRTRIRTTVIEGGRAPRVNNVNFSINVGTAVPRSVRLAPVPQVIVEVHPQWRGFMYFVYNDEIIIVDRRTHKIVAVVEV